MQAKKISQSSAVMVVPMTPQDANVAGNVHGGVIMKLIDDVGGIVALRHTRSNAVTASVDKIDFIHPVFIGDVLTLKASLNLVGRTSMEIGVRVESENPRTGEIKHTASAFLTYVALDENGNPLEVAPLILETERDKVHNREAQARREHRLSERMKKG
ncbi:acyl-CoA thioesterase [Chloroflexota bacterium]